VADIEQKPHRKHLANCASPYSHLPAGYPEASSLRRPNPAIPASHTSQKRRLLTQAFSSLNGDVWLLTMDFGANFQKLTQVFVHCKN